MHQPRPSTGGQALSALAVLLLASSCQSVFIEQRIADLDVDGEVNTEFAGSTSSNSFGAFGIQESNLSALPSITLETAPSTIVLDYFSRETVGVGVLEDDLVLDGVDIGAGTTVQSEQEITFARLRYLFDLASSDTMDLAIGLGLAYVSLDIQVDGGFDRGEYDEAAPLPLLTAQWALRRGDWELELDASYSQFEIDDAEADYASAMASVRWSFLESPARAALSLGYRIEDLDLMFETDEDETIDYNADIDGLFLGLQFAF